MNSLRFLRGAIVYAQVGMTEKDRIFFRIMMRKDQMIRLKQLYAVEVDGKSIPGEINPEGDCFWRKVKMVGDTEYGAPYQIGNFSAWLRLFRKPKGGVRKGAGRKPGGGKGRVQKSRTICLSDAEWDLFDRLRGQTRRGDFLRKLMAMSQLKEL